MRYYRRPIRTVPHRRNPRRLSLIHIYLLYIFRYAELLPSNGRRQIEGMRERDHQRDLFRRGYARTGLDTIQAVSYTHLDVYKRQTYPLCIPKEKTLSMIQLIRLRKTYHLRISKPTGIRIRLPCICTERIGPFQIISVAFVTFATRP